MTMTVGLLAHLGANLGLTPNPLTRTTVNARFAPRVNPVVEKRVYL